MRNIFLNRNKILGINERNHEYIRPFNPRSARKIADDKVASKLILNEAEIPTPDIIKVIKSQKQLDTFDLNKLPKSFVVKPVKGFEGSGIEIIYNRNKKGEYICSKARKMSESELRYHMQNILEGRFSHNYSPDHVLIEERIQPHKKFRPYTYKGTPDIRVVVFNRIPVMAMVRWPTRESQGKANLSQGAVGSGIDLATGVTTHSLQEGSDGRIREVEFVENSHVRYSGFQIPYWTKILYASSRASAATGLGFCAADFLIDRKKGPLIVELNARPGLRIQVANQDGLKWRLEQVRNLRVKSTAHAVRLGRDMFGGEIQEEIEALAGKKIISLIQPVKLLHRSSNQKTLVSAKVDTGAGFSSIDTKIARELGFGKAIKYFHSFDFPAVFESREAALAAEKKLSEDIAEKDEDLGIINTHVIKSSTGITLRIAVRITCIVQDQEYDIEVNIRDRSNLKFPMIIGQRSLKQFLIDPSRA